MSERICIVPGCDKAAKARSRECSMHRARMARRGTYECAQPRRSARGICTIEGCGKPDDGPHGLCQMHRSRQLRNGTTDKLDPRARIGDRITYSGMHRRVREIRGSAQDHACVACAGQAAQWAYDHAESDEKFTPEGYAFSVDVEHYLPMCLSCHQRFDLAPENGLPAPLPGPSKWMTGNTRARRMAGLLPRKR